MPLARGGLDGQNLPKTVLSHSNGHQQRHRAYRASPLGLEVGGVEIQVGIRPVQAVRAPLLEGLIKTPCNPTRGVFRDLDAGELTGNRLDLARVMAVAFAAASGHALAAFGLELLGHLLLQDLFKDSLDPFADAALELLVGESFVGVVHWVQPPVQ
jgi:hypothetical protein